MKKTISLILAFALALSLAVPVFSAQLKSFSDVPKDKWSHDAIMEMVKRGMFNGTKDPDANGVGEFSPLGTMTKSQFIAVVTRYLYNNELNKMPAGATWYYNNYMIALQKGLITEYEFSFNDFDTAMTREEAALVIVRALKAQGETVNTTVDLYRIPDYNKIDRYYEDYVLAAFSMGMISGYDDAGTFGAKDTLTREQGAMIIYRLIDKDSRVYPKQIGASWVEGQIHGKPKAGDVVIKADGTRVVLKEVQIGNTMVLGFGQGADIYTGVTINGRTVREGNPHWDDSTPFVKSELTGEMYSQQTWDVIVQSTDPTNKYVGDYDGEIYMVYWRWDADGYDFNENAYSGIWEWIGW